MELSLIKDSTLQKLTKKMFCFSPFTVNMKLCRTKFDLRRHPIAEVCFLTESFSQLDINELNEASVSAIYLQMSRE